MRIFETHAHLLDEAFDMDREDTISLMKQNGVAYAVEACCKADNIQPILQLHREHPFILTTAGIHPEEIDDCSKSDLTVIENAASNHLPVAIGEIGLDYHFEDMCAEELQKEIFEAQLSIAEQYGLPVIIHDRDAHGDCMDILKARKGRVKGIMHCFSGSWETAKECLDIGLHLGFGGVITFKNAKKARAVLERMPLDGIVFETDSPYMAPEPFRGKRNDPSLIPYIISAAASIRNEDAVELSEAVFKNSMSIFSLD